MKFWDFCQRSAFNGGVVPWNSGCSDQKLNFPFLVFHLGPERRGAVSAEIFVLIPIRQDQEKAFAHGNGLPATGAEELTGFKLVVSRLGAGGYILTSRI